MFPDLDKFLFCTNYICTILALVGIFYVCKIGIIILWEVLQAFRAHILSKLFPVDFSDKYGKWAVITGCTSGIGRAYTIELARRGLSVVLISRNMDKLRALAANIEKDFKVETKIIQADFFEGRSLYQRLAEELVSVDIGILVNNVGVLSDEMYYVSELKESYIWETINVNIGATTMMTRIILPSMIRRGRGAIVNNSSVTAFRPLPLVAMYSSSKAFITAWSTALSEECRGSGVTIQTLEPGCVNTDLLNVSQAVRNISTLFIPTPEQFARNAVATIGVTQRTAGYWFHGFVQWFSINTVPEWIFMRVAHWITWRLRLQERPDAQRLPWGTTGVQNNLTHL